MSSISLLLSAVGPGSADLLRWDLGMKPQKELVLMYGASSKAPIAEMALRVDHVFAIDQEGNEHFVGHLGGQRILIGSKTRANSLKMEGAVTLDPGTYTRMRFYIAEGSSTTSTQRVTEKLEAVEFVEFDIENNFSVQAGEVIEFQLTFRLNSFSFRSFWDSYGEHLFAPWMRGRLGNMF